MQLPRATLLASLLLIGSTPLLAIATGSGSFVSPLAEDVPEGDHLDEAFELLHHEWAVARERWKQASLEAAESGEPPPDVPEVVFVRRFQDLVERGSGRAALWRLEHYRASLEFEDAKPLSPEARSELHELYLGLVAGFPEDVELLVPALFDRMLAERDLSSIEITGFAEKLELTSREPEVRSHSLLVRGLLTAPLTETDPMVQAAAGALFDRVVDEFPGTVAAFAAEQARWRLDNLAVGRRAPDFVTFDSVGNEIRLEVLRGRVVVVHFVGGDLDETASALESASRLRLEMWDERFSWIAIHEHPDKTAHEILLADPLTLGTHAWEGGDARPAIDTWRLPERPLLFLLDGAGYVRAIEPGEAELHLLIEELVAELPPLTDGDVVPTVSGTESSETEQETEQDAE